MAKITKQSEDFSKWYLDTVKIAELADYSKVKGCMVIKPWGYAIWEHLQRGLDKKIKAAGVKNVYFPMFIPESFINREKEHVEGFAPECAIVTHGGGKKLAEPLYVRPTSETIMYDTFSEWIQSYRDLPLKINQWANIVRWEMRTRPFLRTTEFLWQEGHTAHETKEEADAEANRALKMYKDFDREFLALPVLTGKKSEKEKFAGALYTLCTEALARDGKAIQAGTSHNLGQGFAESFGINFLDKNNESQKVWQTSWGVSTRLIGTIIVVHGDDNGLRLPPRVAPVQIMGVPIYRSDDDKANVMGAFEKIKEGISKIKWNDEEIRFEIDDRDEMSPGYKFNEWESKGVPLRIELGPKDFENGSCVLVRRDTGEKQNVKLSDVVEAIPDIMTDIQTGLYDQAKKFQEENTSDVTDYQEFKQKLEEGGFLRSGWCGSEKCEQKIQEETKATIRIVESESDDGECVYCAAKSQHKVILAKAY